MSSGSEKMISSISHSLPISDLIQHIKHSFRESEFNEVQEILINRENAMKTEMEDVARERDSAKKELCLLEKTHAFSDLEKLKLIEKFQRSDRKCEELEERIVRLNEEKRVSSDREKRADDRYEKMSAENSKMMNEKIKVIFELNDKINELKKKNLENQRLIGGCEENFRSLDMKLLKIGQEAEDLRNEKLAAIKTAEELRIKHLEADKVVKELQRENLEANKAIDDLRLKKSESDKAVELYKSRLENLSPRVKRIEEDIAGILSANVGDIPKLVTEVCKIGTLGFPDSKGKKDSSGSGSTPDDNERAILMSPGVQSTSNSTGSRRHGLSKKGDGNSAQPWTRDDIAHAAKTSPGSQPASNPPSADINGAVKEKDQKEQQGSGAHASGTWLMSAAGRFSKSASAAGDIIEILDSDDETNPDGSPNKSNRGKGSNVGENEVNLVQSPSYSQRSKRSRTDCVKDLFINSATKRKVTTMVTRDEDNASILEKKNQVLKPSNDRIDRSSSGRREEKKVGPACARTPLEKSKGLIDEDSDSDESCTDSRMEDLVASIRRNRKWVYEADMSVAFLEDDELCMNAVCALYRQQQSAKKSTGRSNSSKNGGFSPVDSTSGCKLVEYLIDGDKELKLRKSVSDVKKQHPEMIGQCRKLARNNAAKLFEIYCSAKDPFFGRS